MKKLTNRRVFGIASFMAAMAMLAVNVFADSTDFSTVVQPIVDLLNSLLTPLLAIVGAVGALYCVFLGIKFAKAEEPQEREKAKAHLRNAIIGFGLIFVLILALDLLMPIMTDWVANNTGSTGSSGT